MTNYGYEDEAEHIDLSGDYSEEPPF